MDEADQLRRTRRSRGRRLVDSVYIAVAVVAAFALGFVVLGEAISVYLGSLSDGDQASILFGTGTVVLTGVALLIAIVSFYGWDNIQGKVETEVKKYMRAEREYDRAQGRFAQGVSFGAMAMFLLRLPKLENGDRDPAFLLNQAIRYTEASIPGLQGTALEHHAKNNLAYYLALRGRVADGARAIRMIQEAEDHLGAASLDITLMLTKGAVLAEYPEVASEEQLRTTLRSLEETAELDALDAFKQIEYDLVTNDLRSQLQASAAGHGPEDTD